AVHTNPDRHFLRLRSTHNLTHTLVCTDVAGIESQLVDARFEGHQREFVMEVNVGDERDVRHALADLFQRHGRVVVRNGKADDLTTCADHLVDLRDSSAHVRSISLCHRLNRNGSATTDLNVLDLNWSRFAHEL